MTEWVDCRQLTENEKSVVFGDEFRHIFVTRARFDGGVQMVEALLFGHLVVLVGDPKKALMTYLGGRSDDLEIEQ